MPAVQDLFYSIPLIERDPSHPVPMRSNHWPNGYPYLCTLVLWVSTFKLLATECYRHSDTSQPIPFNSPFRADSNKTLPDSGGHPLAKVSAFLSLLTCIAMWRLRNQYHSIPLDERNPTHSVPKLSDNWLMGHPFFCTLVPWARTFKLLATRCKGMRTLRDLYNSIPLHERTPMRPFPTLVDICPLRYLPFPSG